MEPDVTFIERTKRVFVNMRKDPLKCRNPYVCIFDVPISNVLAISLNIVNIRGEFNPDDTSVCIYIPEIQGAYDWYDSVSGKASINPFAFIPTTGDTYARWTHDPITKVFEYPIPLLPFFTIILLDLDQALDSRITYAEMWFTFKYMTASNITDTNECKYM